MANEEERKGNVTGGRCPLRQLPVVRSVDGTMLLATVSCRGGGASISKQSGNDATPVLDLTGSRFEIAIEVDGQRFSGAGSAGSHALEPIIHEMSHAGYALRCCRTCACYRPSGMVSQWSFGSQGYCLALGEPSMQHLTHILHVCDQWDERDGSAYGPGW